MKLKKLFDMEPGPNKAVQLAAKLGITEPYIRMIISGKAKAGWRLQRDIDALYVLSTLSTGNQDRNKGRV